MINGLAFATATLGIRRPSSVTPVPPVTFNPLTLFGGDDYGFWLDHSLSPTKTMGGGEASFGDVVSSVEDLGPSNGVFTGVGGLLYTEAGWYIDGVNDYIHATGLSSIPQPFTVVHKIQYILPIDGPGDVYRDTRSNAVGYTQAPNNEYNIYAGSVLNSNVYTGANPGTDVRIDTFDGANSSIRLDGTEIAYGNAGNLPLINVGFPLQIGRGAVASSPAMYLRSILVINRVLTTSEIADIERYLID